MFFMVREGFEYTVAVYFYAFLLAFCRILHCILQRFALRLAPKRTAFSTKTHYILPQMAQNGCKYRFFWNNNSFCSIHCLPPFSIETNLRENRFFAAEWAVGG
jgi:hypothetical protein